MSRILSAHCCSSIWREEVSLVKLKTILWGSGGWQTARHGVPGRQFLTCSCWMCRTQRRAAELTEHCCLLHSPLLGLWRCFCDRKSNSCDWKAFLLSVMCVGMSIWLRWQQYCVNVSAIEKWFWMHSFVLGRCESLTPGMLKDDVKWGNQLKIKYNIYPSCPCLFTAIRTCNWCPGWNLLLCVELL